MTTERRQEYIRAIDGYFRRNDQLPSCPKLAELMGTTPNAAFEIYTKLERAGIVSRNEQNKFKRGPRWPKGISWDRQEQGEQTHPAATLQFGTSSNPVRKASSSWPPLHLCGRTQGEVTCGCIRFTSTEASARVESWFSKTRQH